VVPPEDSDALVAAIEKLFNDDNARIVFGHHARHYAKEIFDKNSVLERLVNQLHFLSRESSVAAELR